MIIYAEHLTDLLNELNSLDKNRHFEIYEKEYYDDDKGYIMEENNEEERIWKYEFLIDGGDEVYYLT